MNRVIWLNNGWMPHYHGFCPSALAWRNEMKRMEISDPGAYPPDDGIKAATSLYRRKDNKKRVAIVTVADGQSAENVVELLVHEAMHVWRDILEAIQEEKPSSEFEAYAMQNIFSGLLDAYQKTRGTLLVHRHSDRARIKPVR